MDRTLVAAPEVNGVVFVQLDGVAFSGTVIIRGGSGGSRTPGRELSGYPMSSRRANVAGRVSLVVGGLCLGGL